MVSGLGGFARYEKESLRRLKEGWVTDVQFSGSTYLIEITDPKTKEKAYAFFQFDENSTLKDAFCSCEKESCLHLAVAFLKIFGDKREPLHLRFKKSLWFHLTRLFAEEVGFDPKLFVKKKEGEFFLDNQLSFHIVAKRAESKKKAIQILVKREKETPETSIKFSNLSPHEIELWRQGRPSFHLRYELSFWSDLAKWLFLMEEEKIEFNEKGLPLTYTVYFPTLTLSFTLTPEALSKIVASFSTLRFPLKVQPEGTFSIEKISYDPKKRALHIHHAQKEFIDETKEKIFFDEWIYVKDVGFYRKSERSPLEKEWIEEKEMDETLCHLGKTIAPYLVDDTIHFDPVELNYELFFDDSYNLHIAGYLFKRGDLSEGKGGAFFGRWAYLPNQGFFRLKEPLFSGSEQVIEKRQVGRFISEHRPFFADKAGFTLHVSGIETTFGFEITKEKNLRLFSTFESADIKDFGEYLYFKNLGFFPKRESRLALLLRPDLEIRKEKISSFLCDFKEDLENISGFFCPKLPIDKRGLTMMRKGKRILIRPTIRLIKEYEKSETTLFDDAIYIKGIGFYDLSNVMRLPDNYQVERFIKKRELAAFLYKELAQLEPFILSTDPALIAPATLMLELSYLERAKGGGITASIHLKTEIGIVSLSEILDASHHKNRFCFTKAGRFDLKEERFEWLARIKEGDLEKKALLLTSLDFFKLDATFGFTVRENHPEIDALLSELREFKTRKPPNYSGLKSELRLYQKKGVDWLWFLSQNGLSGLLCDEMGLGKTHQAMALMQSLYNEEKSLFLIVAPTSVIYHWEDKLTRFLPSLPLTLFHGLARGKKGIPREGILLTSYGILRLEKDLLSKIPFRLAIFDEIQIAKNSKSQIHNALAKIDAGMKIGLTGTPIENNLNELKSLFDLTLPSYFPNENRFKEIFLLPIEREHDEKKKRLLTQLTRPFILRRKKREVLAELPEKSEDKFTCDLSDEQSALYKKAVEEARGDINQLYQKGATIPYLHIFALLSKLKQISDHPALFLKDPKNFKRHSSGKWDLFVELLSESLASEQKVVVFSQYLYMLDIITNFLNEQKIGFAEIRGDTVNRKEEMRRFAEDESCRVFVGSLQAAGLGIDLTAASTVILYDRWWNAARENQAIDRVHRIGQKWAVQVYKLISKGTIEEKIDQIITKKSKLMEEIIPVDDEAEIKTLSREELIDILSYI